MRVFVIGVTGRVGSLLAERLVARGDDVRGLVRREAQRQELASAGVDAVVGDLTTVTAEGLAEAIGDADAVVFCSGTDGDDLDAIDAIDRDGALTALDAVRARGGGRFLLVSAMPEGWRERVLGPELDHYFATKKQVDVLVSGSDVDWLIVRPSELTDDPATGEVALGPAELHERVARGDVASTLAELLHRPRVRRRILELNRGTTPIPVAVDAVDDG